MQKVVAFLRAINVGGHVVKMDMLRQLFSDLGFFNVTTFIASGNVIFETEASPDASLEQKIARHLQAALGFEVITFLRTFADLAALLDYQPFPSSDVQAEGNELYVAFLAGPASSASIQKLLALSNAVDDFHVHGGEAYWLRRRLAGESQYTGMQIEKVLGQPATVRNSVTLHKLLAKYR